MRPHFRRILVPLDFSPPSDRALLYAKALATEFTAPLELLHVIEDRLMAGPWPTEVYLGELPRIRENLVKEAERRLAETIESLANYGIKSTGQVLIGSPSQVIIEQADATNADLIVMGTHGRTGITHLLIGSVAERVIRHARCPVFVVRERAIAEESLAPAAVAR
jgi:universal stress protein A